jgi:hypothetical protein
MSIWISASAGLETTSGNTVRSLAASGQHTCGHEGLSPPVLLVRPTRGRPVSPETLLLPCVHSNLVHICTHYLLKVITIQYLLSAVCFGGNWQNTCEEVFVFVQ